MQNAENLRKIHKTFHSHHDPGAEEQILRTIKLYDMHMGTQV